MKQFGHVCVIVTLSTSALAAACGGAAADKIRPKDLTAKDALGGAAPACTGDPKLARPLIVDLESDARIDLEASLKKGVVVVSYDCNELHVLSSCKVPEGTYEYAGASRDEKVVQLKGADELKVNLPLSAGKLGAEVQAGHSIDLGLILVGRRTTLVAKVKRSDLTGTCDGATHFLQKAFVGAFAMTTGSGAKVSAAGDLFNVGASGKSESSRSATSSVGTLESCRTSNPDSDAPPGECQAPLRIELVPILGPAEKKAEPDKQADGEKKPAAAQADKGPPDPKKAALTAEENPCRPGYAFANGICTAAKDVAFLCDPKEPEVCKTQCEKGDSGSCYNYGVYQHGLAKDGHADANPIPFLQKACEGQEAAACGAWGREIVPKDHAKDDLDAFQRAFALEKKACEMADGRSCWWLGAWQRDSTSPKTFDETAASRTFVRGCTLGDVTSCRDAASAYILGIGVTKDVGKGLAIGAKACASGNAAVCVDLAEDLWFGRNGTVPVDLERALGAAKRACDEGEGPWRDRACEITPELMIDLGRSEDAFKYATQGCNLDTGDGCYALYEIYSGKSAKKNPTAARAIYKKICDDSVNQALDGMRTNNPREKPMCKTTTGKPGPTKAKGKPKKK